MTRFEREIERQRRRLTVVDERATLRIVRRFEWVRTVLARRTRTLLDTVTRRRKRGQPVTSSWLHGSDELTALVADTTEQIIPFLSEALRLTEEGQGRMMDEAAPDVRRLAELALGPAPGDRPPPLPRWLALELGQLRADVANRILGSATDGRPLALLFAELAPEHSQRIIDTIVSGVRSGRSVDLIAEDVRQLSGMTLSRASTIARTEIGRARNEAQQEVMLTPESPIEEWVWHARLDACASCQAQHGSVHPITEILRSHPNDRCIMVPRMPPWSALGFPGVPDLRPRIQTGPERFATFDPAAQLAILGPGKFEAYRTGKITLADLVTHTHSERWGPGTREASLTEALA